jgi:hypothetical protein
MPNVTTEIGAGTLSAGDKFVGVDGGAVKLFTIEALVAYITGVLGSTTGFTVANPDGGYQLVQANTNTGQVLFKIRMRSGSDDPLVVSDASNTELFRVDTTGTITSSAGWVGNLPVSGYAQATSFRIGAALGIYTIATTVNGGDPEGQVTAGPGSTCHSENGRIYRKVTGTGNTGWEPLALARLPLSTRSGTTYTLAASDEFVVTEFSSASAVTLTVPTNATVPIAVGTVFNLRQVGAGQVTVSGAGTTINGYAGLKSAGQWASWTLEKRATDTWLMEGITAV